MGLKQTIERSDTRAGRAFDLSIQALIVVSLVSFTIETLPNLSQAARYWLYVVEVVTVAIFTAEYVLRLLVADNRLRFIFSFYGLVDLAAIVPFYIATGVDLRSARVLRLIRVFRVFKVVRYTDAMDRFKAAFRDVKQELILFLIVAAMLLYLTAVGIYYFESDAQPEQFGSVPQSLWWSIVTLTTVGYGDVYPVTVGGRIFTSVVLILGLGIVAVPTGLLASAFNKR
ncbi:MAG: ion transporter [Pirellulales bacterium]